MSMDSDIVTGFCRREWRDSISVAGVQLRRLMCGAIEFEDKNNDTICAESKALTALFERLKQADQSENHGRV